MTNYSYLEIYITLANIEKMPRSILVKYSDFINKFLKKLTVKLYERLNINKYSINLEKDK